MIQVFRETGALALPDDVSPLGIECSNATGTNVTVSVTRQVDLSGALDPTKDRVIYTCDVAPNEVSLDAAIAAYPTTTAGVTGTIALSKGVPVVLYERTLLVGEVLWLDLHFFGMLGNIADADPESLDGYGIAWRESAGDVKVTRIDGPASGRIPGFELASVGTATTVQITAEARKAGTLTIFENTVEVKNKGTLPA